MQRQQEESPFTVSCDCGECEICDYQQMLGVDLSPKIAIARREVPFRWKVASLWRSCPAHIIHVYALGLHFGYPRCCILAFMKDVVLNRPAASVRGTVRVEGTPTEYVPCLKHVRM